MASIEEVNAAMPLLLDAAEAVCPAAVDAFWARDQPIQSAYDANVMLSARKLDKVDTALSAALASVKACSTQVSHCARS